MPRRPSQSAFSFQMPRLLPGVRGLMIALAAVTIAIRSLASLFGQAELAEKLMRAVVLVPAELWHGKLWLLFSYTFFYAGDPIWFIFALAMIWMFGTPLEQQWGTRRFLGFYFASTALAGLATALLALPIHALAPVPASGVWAGAEALVAGYALTFPTLQVFAAMIIPVQARLLIPISIATMVVIVLLEGVWPMVVTPLFALLIGMALHDARGPKNLWLRLKVRWIERRMRGSRLRVVPGLPRDDELPQQRSGGRGSDGFLH